MTDTPPSPSGTPLGLLVEGILDGRTTSAAPLLQATEALGECGAGPFRCEVQGGRFTLLPRDTQVSPARFDEAAQARFLEALQTVVQAATKGSVESNLRCRMIYATEVAETLFVVRGERIEPMTRRRPRTPADDTMLPPVATALPFGMRRREVLIAAPLLFVVAMVVAWQTGWIDRVLAARAEAMAVDNGPFAAMLAPTLVRSWGDYVVLLRRGPDYPATAKELTERRDRLEGLAERAACEAVGNGGDLFVQVLDPAGKVLVETRAELRPLLVDDNAVIETKLPGRMNAASIRLSLSAAPKNR